MNHILKSVLLWVGIPTLIIAPISGLLIYNAVTPIQIGFIHATEIGAFENVSNKPIERNKKSQVFIGASNWQDDAQDIEDKSAFWDIMTQEALKVNQDVGGILSPENVNYFVSFQKLIGYNDTLAALLEMRSRVPALLANAPIDFNLWLRTINHPTHGEVEVVQFEFNSVTYQIDENIGYSPEAKADFEATYLKQVKKLTFKVGARVEIQGFIDSAPKPMTTTMELEKHLNGLKLDTKIALIDGAVKAEIADLTFGVTISTDQTSTNQDVIISITNAKANSGYEITTHIGTITAILAPISSFLN